MDKEELGIDNKRLDFNEKVQLVVKKEELKEQDIRLNKLCFDYQEKEKQIQIDAEQIRALQNQNGELTDKVRKLEQQVEKMKCCGNCRFSESDKLNGTFCHREGCFVVASANCKLWEN